MRNAQIITVVIAQYENEPHPVCLGTSVSGVIVVSGEVVVSGALVVILVCVVSGAVVVSGGFVSVTLSPFT